MYCGPCDVHREYVEQTIVKDTTLHYFDDNTYDEDYEFTVDSCVCNVDTLQYHGHSIIPSGILQIP